MYNNITKVIQSYVNNDGGETLSQSYEDRLNNVFLIFIKDFSRVIARSTHISNKTRVYLEFSRAFKLKFKDVKKIGELASELNVEELVEEIINA